MAINVYAWPPVCGVGRSWTPEQPNAVLRSALTGKDQRQSSQRERIFAAIDVPARYRSASPASGYMEVLRRLLAGGVNAVRLTSWSASVRPNDGDVFSRLTIGMTAVATTSGGFGAWRVDGLPPGYPLIWPGDRFRVGSTVWQAINEAVADATGRATIKVFGTPSGSGALTLGQQETAVFRVDGDFPAGPMQIGSFSYSLQLRQVFSDEVGGFTEVNPWI